MNTPYETLQVAQSLGIALYAEGEHLRFKAPVGVMTLDLKRALKTHKNALLALLTWSGNTLVHLRAEIAEMARDEEGMWELSDKLDPRWPPSAKVHKRLRHKAVSLWETSRENVE